MEFNLEMAIAKVAHECWQRRLVEEGWRSGDRHDEVARVHDALRPFDELSAFDRHAIALACRCEGFAHTLADAAERMLFRGPQREFTTDDIHEGDRVLSVSCDGTFGPEAGEILSWEVADPVLGRLDVIRVQWDDGTVGEYAAAERAIARASEV